MVRLKCPPIRDYPLDIQKKAGEELAKLPSGSVLPGVVTDYSQLRDACRAINKR